MRKTVRRSMRIAGSQLKFEPNTPQIRVQSVTATLTLYVTISVITVMNKLLEGLIAFIFDAIGTAMKKTCPAIFVAAGTFIEPMPSNDRRINRQAHNHIENHGCKNSSIVACVFVTTLKFLPNLLPSNVHKETQRPNGDIYEVRR
jgi:hypothetical protein